VIEARGRVSGTLKRVRFRHRLLRKPVVIRRYRGLGSADAFLSSYPRSGTTWLRFLLFEALSGGPAEFGQARHGVPSVGQHRNAMRLLPGGGRVIQTHEPRCDRARKTVYVVRDPRSVAVSEFRWQQRLGIEVGGLEQFVEDFSRGRSNPWGSWADHVEYWLSSPSAEEGLLHLVRFEELRGDPVAVFAGVLDFLGVPLEAAAVESAVAANSLESMRMKEDRARRAGWRSQLRGDIRFVNTGDTQGWRDQLGPDLIRKIEASFGSTLTRLGYDPVR
jgi:hypothetical protein